MAAEFGALQLFPWGPMGALRHGLIACVVVAIYSHCGSSKHQTLKIKLLQILAFVIATSIFFGDTLGAA